MAKHSHVALSEVTIFQENYFKAFPCIPKYHDYVRQEIQNSAVLTTLLGRRRRFFGLNFPGYGKEMFEATIREAVAYCPQSMTADEIDTGLLRLFNEHFVELLLQVHDSILLQCWEHEVEAVAAKVKKLLEVHIPLVRGRDFFVPVELKVGWNWRDRYTDKEGKVHNEDGLVKWTGSLDRRRTESKQLTLQDFL
jgi:DNA polymerase I-like protein with 3'-5' exonuclease and polymerase domains